VSSDAARESRPRRVAVYTDSSGVGGAEASLGHLVRELGPRYDVVVAGVDENVVARVAEGRPGARRLVLPFIRSALDLPSIVAHTRMLARVRPDVLHVNLITPWSAHVAILLGLLTPAVRVVAVEQLPRPVPNARQRLIKRLLSRRLAAHVAVGDRSAREIERLVGLPSGFVRTIHNAVPDLGPSPQHARDDRTIGFVGRIEPQKGLDVLLRALVHVPDSRLRVVGDGTERPQLERLASELGVADRVIWSGWSESPRETLSSFTVLAFPSRYEGFPLAVLEALLASTPVVATDVGSISEAVVDGETGVLVPSEDPSALAEALRQLLGDSERRNLLGERGRALVLAQYTSDRMARAFEALYDEICG
jgi:glycosyltransferase involved in cell wall biosynthesis